jgi:nicotinamidase-related amidase
MPTRSRVPRAETAVLIVDVINPFDFDGGRALATRARPVARAIARLRDRARRAGVPIIYVNDNLGRWRSDIHALVRHCTRDGMPGAEVVRLLTPGPADFVILKSTLSGFYQTPLEALLRAGGVRTVVVTGLTSDNCVLFTAADAYMRDFRVVVPSDCVTAKRARDHREALARMAALFEASTPASSALRLSRRGRR